MKKYSTLIVLLFISSLLFSQEDGDFPALNNSDIHIVQEKYFDGNGLWGHIDGGADLYLEYGFDKLLFQEVEWQNNKFRVEYYKMKDPEAAFGIFSVSKFKCDYTDTLTKYICITKYQTQAALDKFYISIANETGSDKARDLTVKLFSRILNKCTEDLYYFPDLFTLPFTANDYNNIKLFKGRLGIQNGLPLWSELFDGISGYKIFVAPFENKNGFINFSFIQFESNKELQKFITGMGFTQNKPYIKKGNYLYLVKFLSDNEIYFCESSLNIKETEKIIGLHFD